MNARIIALLFLLLATAPCSAAMSCDRAPRPQKEPWAYEMGRVWSGARTAIGSARADDGRIIVAFYDAERYVTVASLDPRSGEVCKVRLNSQFDGWDSHNTLRVVVADDGTLHVAGNFHADPLFYANGVAKDLSTLKPAKMIGRDENRATYPKFLRGPSGDLLFLYRNGGSGDGKWFANRWQNGSWSRVGQLFADRDSKGRVSAYPSDFEIGSDGTFHVAVVWRRNPDVASNFAVGYAKSKDLKSWSGIGGRSFEGPLSPDRIDVVESPGEGAGLVNGVELILSANEDPVIAYTRFGADGNDAVVLARPSGTRWTIKEVFNSPHRSKISGRGSLPHLPTVRLSRDGDDGRLIASLPPGPHRTSWVDLASLELKRPQKAAKKSPTVRPPPKHVTVDIPASVPDARQFTANVLASGLGQPTFGRLVWYAHPSVGDRPRECTAAATAACAPPPSPLLWTPE